jgi:glycine hydroxymethyltransferase
MAHFAGLVAGGVFTGDYSPFPHAHVVTTTTHKTLRGPRAGMVPSTLEFAEALDKGCPLTMGGPLPHVIAAKAVAFREAGTPAFKTYAAKIVQNSQALAASFMQNGLDVLTGGTDNHITLNRNSLPFDPNGPWYTSGLRIGTAATTSLGMGTEEMKELGSIISLVLKHTTPAPDGKDPAKKSKAKYVVESAAKTEALSRVEKLLGRFPVYPQLDLALLKDAFVQ